MRSLLRWLRRLAFTALVLGAAVLGAALVTAHTGWGREQLRSRVEAALQGAFPGGARVASLDGSFLGTLTLQGVELDGRDHRPLVTAATLRVSVALWPLVVRTARLDRVVADDVRVFVRDQPPAPVPDRPGEPSPWQVEIPALEVHRASVAIERARLALGDLDVAGAVTAAGGRAWVSGAVHGRWSRAGRPAVVLAAAGSAVLDGGVRIPGAIVALDGATVIATGLALDPDHPSGSITVAAPAAAIAALVPELGELGVAVPGDGVAAIDLAADGAATRLSVTAAAGEARLWAMLRGEPARRTARGLIAATAIDLGAATHGRIAGRGNLLAAIDAGPGRARGALIAHGELAVAGLPVHRAGVAIAGGLDGVTALALGGGDDALRAAAVVRGHREAGGIVVDRARAVATARGLAVPGQRIAGELALDATTAGAFAPGGDARITGVVVGRGVTVAPEPATPGAAERTTIGAVRSPFVVTLGRGREGGAAIAVAVRDARAIAVAHGDVALAAVQGSLDAAQGSLDAAQGSLTLGVGPRFQPGSRSGSQPEVSAELPPGLRIDGAWLAVTGIRRAGSALGDARVELERRGAAYRVAVTARPQVAGLAIAAQAVVRRARSGYGVALGASSVRLPGGAAWSGGGGSLVIPDAAAAPIRLVGLTLRRGAASVALAGSYARATGELAAHAGAERVDAASLGLDGVAAGAHGFGDATLDVARHGGQWQADAAVTVTGLAVAPGATPVDATAHLVLARRRATLEARAAGPALGDLGLAFDTDAPGDPLDLAAWRRLDRGAIRTAAITARQVALPGLAGLIAPAGAPSAGTTAVPLAAPPAAPPVGVPASTIAGTAAGTIAAPPVGVPAGTIAGTAAGTIAVPLVAPPAAPAVGLVAPAGGPRGMAGTTIAGTIDGAVDLAPVALRGELAVRGVALPSGTLDGDITLAPHDGDLGAHAAARLVGVAAADLTARFAVPEHPFDPATWQHRGRDLLREATAVAADVAFDPALLARLGIGAAPPLSGRASARLALGAAARDARLAVSLSGVTGGPLVAPVSSHAELDAGPSGSHLHAELHGGAGGAAADGGPSLGVLDGDVPMTVDRWLDEPAAVLRAPLTASWTLHPTPVVPVLALLGRHELEAGTLEGSAEIRGTVATPVIPSVRLVARDVRSAPRLGGRPAPAVRELEVAATWGGASGTLTIHGSEATGGELHAVANGRPDALAAATGTARLTRLDVAPIAAFLPGALASAAGVVDGELALRPGGRLAGNLHVAGGALPLAAAVGTLRDASLDLASDGSAIHARLRGRLGRGTVDVDADAPADLGAATARLTLRGVSPIAALRPVISAELTARLHRDAGGLRGTVTVADGASITLPERTGAPLLDPTVPADLQLAGAPAARLRDPRAPSHPWLVLDVQTRSIRLDARELTEGVGLTGMLQSDRLVVSIGDTVGVTGVVRLDSDNVEILGRRYVIEPTRDGPSGLTFDGTIDPRVKIAMSYQFPELTLNVGVSGRLSKLDPPSFSSDPAGLYSQDQLFGFFLGGEPSTDAGSQTRDQAREAIAGASTRVISARLGKQINKVLPVKVDALSCEPDPAATAAASGSCTVGKWLSQRLFVAYRQRLQPRPDENTGDVQVQFRMGSRILIQGTGGDRGYYGADLLWRHRW